MSWEKEISNNAERVDFRVKSLGANFVKIRKNKDSIEEQIMIGKVLA